YPNLANLPTRTWLGTIFGNKIYGVPVPISPYYRWFWTHQELLDAAGEAQPNTAAELKKLLIEYTRPNDDQYGIGYQNGQEAAFGMNNGLWPAIFKAPNTYSVDANGRFTHYFRTDQYKAALDYARDLWANNTFTPKSLGYNTAVARTDFAARKFIFRFDGQVDWSRSTVPARTP